VHWWCPPLRAVATGLSVVARSMFHCLVEWFLSSRVVWVITVPLTNRPDQPVWTVICMASTSAPRSAYLTNWMGHWPGGYDVLHDYLLLYWGCDTMVSADCCVLCVVVPLLPNRPLPLIYALPLQDQLRRWVLSSLLCEPYGQMAAAPRGWSEPGTGTGANVSPQWYLR